MPVEEDFRLKCTEGFTNIFFFTHREYIKDETHILNGNWGLSGKNGIVFCRNVGTFWTLRVFYFTSHGGPENDK